MRRSIAPVLAAVVAACALLAPATPAAAACPNGDTQPTGSNLNAMRDATLCLLNAERTPRGLPALRENARLTEASQAYSKLMVDRQFFAHVTPDGVDLQARLLGVGYIVPSATWMVGENLAWGTGGLATPARIMEAWMESPGHRENILEPEFREVGLGIVTGAPNPRMASGAATYATAFGVLRGTRSADSPSAGAPASPTAKRMRRPKSCAALRRAKARGVRLSKASRKRIARCRSRAAWRARA